MVCKRMKELEMVRRKVEQRFEYRIQNILKRKGFLVINCARSKPFDLIAAKDSEVFFVEVKGKKTWYPSSQREEQMNIVMKHRLKFVLLKQHSTRGKMTFEFFTCLNPLKGETVIEDKDHPIYKALKEFIIK